MPHEGEAPTGHRGARHVDQVGDIAGRQRQLEDALALDHRADAHASRLDRDVGRARRHGDRLVQLAERQRRHRPPGSRSPAGRCWPGRRCGSLAARLRACRDRSEGSGTTYCPVSLVTTDRTSPVSVCVNVTSTPGSTAPDASVTLPLIWPVGVCATTAVEVSAQKKSTAARAREHRFSMRKGLHMIDDGRELDGLRPLRIRHHEARRAMVSGENRISRGDRAGEVDRGGRGECVRWTPDPRDLRPALPGGSRPHTAIHRLPGRPVRADSWRREDLRDRRTSGQGSRRWCHAPGWPALHEPARQRRRGCTSPRWQSWRRSGGPRVTYQRTTARMMNRPQAMCQTPPLGAQRPGRVASHERIVVETRSAASCWTKWPAPGTVTSVKSFSTQFHVPDNPSECSAVSFSP